MPSELFLQGRNLSQTDIGFVREVIQNNPAWRRTRISREICFHWNWRNQKGQLKDMACRALLLKLQERSLIQLPPRVCGNRNDLRHKRGEEVSLDTPLIGEPLRCLQPLSLQLVQKESSSLFVHLLQKYHYLGYSGAVGENIKYLVLDFQGRPMAALLFGSAAWKTQPRDEFIGWKEKKLHLITNNQRFLIAPWVKVPHLASHILSLVSKRISQDWVQKYGHPVYLLETFVDLSRFRGTCYQAANWIFVGETKGRSRQDRYTRLHVPVKGISLYPLVKDFRRRLGCPQGGPTS